MKYIRTKGGIYTYDEVRPYFLDKSQKLYMNNEKEIAIKEKEIVKQADTIEELCDEFVIEYCDGSKLISIHDTTDKFLIEHKDEIEGGYIKNVYGAIWTEKGLIYVAKVNDEGELELL